MPSQPFPDLHVADAQVVTAPDGSTVRILSAGRLGSLARFELEPGSTSTAVRHRTVEELWYVLSGRGAMWRQRGRDASIVAVRPGQSLQLPVGTSFQFRAGDDEPLLILGVTMPPWPGDDEAELVAGCPAWTSEGA